jgi:mannosyltransferase
MENGDLFPTSPSEAPPATRNWRPSAAVTSWLLALITLFAAILRLHAITVRSFWFDEGISVEIARLPWSQFLLALWYREANMTFYYVLLHFWLAMGSSDGFIRGLSVLISAATIPVIYALGARLFGRNAGLLSAWLLAINVYHIRYAQEARGYALVVFLAVLATWLLVRNLQESSSACWGAYAVVCILAVYSHFFGALVVVAHGVSLIFLRRGEVPWRDFARGLRWFSYLMIPIAIFVVSNGPGPINWVQKTQLDTVLGLLILLAGEGGIRLLLLDSVALVLAGFSGWSIWRREGRTLQGWAFVLVFVWLFVPVLIVLAASEVQPLFVARYLNPCLPALVLIVAAGITQLRPALLACILGVAISLASVAAAASFYHHDLDADPGDWSGATSFIFDHAQPGDGVFFYGNLGRIPFEFYRSRRTPPPRWPEELQSPSGSNLDYRNFAVIYLADALRDARPAGDRVWLVLVYDSGPDGGPNRSSKMIRAFYGKGRRLVESLTFSGVTVLLYARDVANVVQTTPPK